MGISGDVAVFSFSLRCGSDVLGAAIGDGMFGARCCVSLCSGGGGGGAGALCGAGGRGGVDGAGGGTGAD